MPKMPEVTVHVTTEPDPKETRGYKASADMWAEQCRTLQRTLLDVQAERDKLRTSFAELGAALIVAKARAVRWVPVWPHDEMPPIDVPVRVVWSERGKSDLKRAVWTGSYWATVRRTGQFEDSPDYWLYEPPVPEPPTKR